MSFSFAWGLVIGFVAGELVTFFLIAAFVGRRDLLEEGEVTDEEKIRELSENELIRRLIVEVESWECGIETGVI